MEIYALNFDVRCEIYVALNTRVNFKRKREKENCGTLCMRTVLEPNKQGKTWPTLNLLCRLASNAAS